MTVRALLALLDEIDRQGGPEAARHDRLRLHDEGAPAPMTAITADLPLPPLVTARPPAADEDPERLPVGRLLKWGDEHEDPDVQAQAAHARAALTGLRQRYTVDRVLTAITTEEQQLQARLAELRAEKEKLAPPKTRRKSPSYDAATVRAWARATGVDCPPRGRVPKRVLDAWCASLPTAAPGPS